MNDSLLVRVRTNRLLRFLQEKIIKRIEKLCKH